MKKRNLLIGIIIATTMIFGGCIDESTDSKQKMETEQLMQEAHNQVGMPNIRHFFERKMMKEVLEKCDNPKLVTYLYTKNLDGKYIYEGRGIGFGIPYSVQFTNPERRLYTSGSGVTLPQADPSGLFKPEGLSATWYMMIDEETGETSVEYWEPNIIVKQKKVRKELCEPWSLPKDY